MNCLCFVQKSDLNLYPYEFNLYWGERERESDAMSHRADVIEVCKNRAEYG